MVLYLVHYKALSTEKTSLVKYFSHSPYSELMLQEVDTISVYITVVELATSTLPIPVFMFRKYS